MLRQDVGCVNRTVGGRNGGDTREDPPKPAAAALRGVGGKRGFKVQTNNGKRPPPPMPWITRNVISSSLVGANAHIADPTVNKASAVRKTIFVPMRSLR